MRSPHTARKSSPRLLQLEKAHATTKTQGSHKYIHTYIHTYIERERERTYCLQKISKRQTVSGRNGTPSASSYFHINRDYGTQNGSTVFKEISFLNENIDYFKAFIPCSSLWCYSHGKNNKQQKVPSDANNCYTSNSIFHEGQESKRILHIRNKK